MTAKKTYKRSLFEPTKATRRKELIFALGLTRDATWDDIVEKAAVLPMVVERCEKWEDKANGLKQSLDESRRLREADGNAHAQYVKRDQESWAAELDTHTKLVMAGATKDLNEAISNGQHTWERALEVVRSYVDMVSRYGATIIELREVIQKDRAELEQLRALKDVLRLHLRRVHGLDCAGVGPMISALVLRIEAKS